MQPAFQRIDPDLSYEYLQSMNLSDLCDLLVVKTAELLSALHQKDENGFKIHDLELEVEKIQTVIKLKRPVRDPFL